VPEMTGLTARDTPGDRQLDLRRLPPCPFGAAIVV